TLRASGLDAGLARPSSGDAWLDRPESVFEYIALAHREIYALYARSQPVSTSLALADTMALISSKLATIVPWSGCSLFLYDRAADSLKCACAVGLDAPRLLNRVLSHGDVTQWAKRSKQTVLNSDPRLTFEMAG